MSKQAYEQIGFAMTCRSYEEYLRMFELTDEDFMQGKVLDVAAGASSFTAEATRRGYEALAIDPRYAKSVQEWVAEASQEIEASTAKLVKLADVFDWSYYGNPDSHKAGRIASLKQFSEHLDTEAGKACYKSGMLPNLPFASDTFSLVLCSHFLFLYADHLGTEFHIQSVLELMRVCKPGGEVRIYPVITLNWEPYAALDELLEAIRLAGGKPELRPSKLPFISGSNMYLSIII